MNFEQNGVNDALNIIDISSIIKKQIMFIAEVMIKIEEIQFLAITGSLAKGMYKDNLSDVDLLVLYNNNFDLKNTIQKLFGYGINLIASDDIFNIEIHGVMTRINICFKNKELFIKHITEVVNLNFFDTVNKDWAIGGVIEEVILYDLSCAIVLFDKEKNTLKKLNRNYGFNFKILKDNLLIQLNNKLKLIKSYAEDGAVTLALFGIMESITVLSRIYCAEKNIYHPGLKHMLLEEKYKEFQTLVGKPIIECQKNLVETLLPLIEKYNNAGK